MRTTLDLPEDILHRAKIAAAQRGSSLRQFVADALRHELERAVPSPRRRMTRPPITLPADAPLRSRSPDAVKRMDAESVAETDALRARVTHR